MQQATKEKSVISVRLDQDTLELIESAQQVMIQGNPHLRGLSRSSFITNCIHIECLRIVEEEAAQ
tara:strand:+ start:660 stop:854 length:195 start_codon:yes stop_codon:yes gene_type:complete